VDQHEVELDVNLRRTGTEAESLWIRRSLSRCLKAFDTADTATDQAAAIREWVRLQGGSATWPRELPESQGFTEHILQRFGLHRAGDTKDFIILDSDLGNISEVLPRALTIDPSRRRPSSEASPDAALIRLSSHRTYQNLAQKAALRAVLTMPPGSNLIVSLATGGGKSLVFQLAARWWKEQSPPSESSCIVVIVPTIALALDHERTARSFAGLENSRALTGALSSQERDNILLDFSYGEIPILFCSPEILVGRAFQFILNTAEDPCNRPTRIKSRLRAVVVDEAHIIESWGRRFRPDFQRIPALVSQLREKNSNLQTILLSATLGDSALQQLREFYGKDSSLLEIAAQVPRTEFELIFQQFPEDRRDAAVIRLMDRMPRPAILYTTYVAHAEALYRGLRERGYNSIALFTGQTSDEQRQSVINQWASDSLDIVVATSAFGMGVDKPNVRAVVHACVPENAPRYYQEIGRGGRDGFQSYAFCAWTDKDVEGAKRQINQEWLTVELFEERWTSLLRSAADRPHTNINTATFEISLDATREELVHTRTGEPNRDWNKAILTFLQRMGVLEVLLPENHGSAASWCVRVLKPDFLDSHSFRRDVFSRREEERQSALEELRLFAETLKKTDFCHLCGLYELVEAGNPLVEPCGQCAPCRSAELPKPKHLDYRGGLRVWRSSTPRNPDKCLVNPSDPSLRQGFHLLLQRLVNIGIDQFAVPDEKATESADILSRLNCALGLVVPLSDLASKVWRLSPGLKTALIMGGQSKAASDLILQDAYETIPDLVIVASPDQLWRGKLLSQSMSLVSYEEANLETMREKSS